MRIHREGYRTLALTAGFLLLLNGLIVRRWPLAVLSLGLWGFLAQFFRNPTRLTPAREGCIMAPADGTIVAMERIYEGEYFHDERLKISIYMSALNVHLNRVPVTGKVVYRQYHPGKYLVAFHPKASELNERNTIVIQAADGQQFLTRQIAGFLARRITCYPQVGEAVTAGDELGFIKFGSRCDLFLPPDSRPQVRLGDKVKGGESIVALWPQE